MSFDQKYRLLEPLPDLNLKADIGLLGREIASGQPVVIHLLAGGHSLENEALQMRARQAPPEHKDAVLDIGDHKGTPYIVTRMLPGDVTVRRWLVGIAAKSPGDTRVDELQRGSIHKVPEVAKAEPGEFTRLLEKGLPTPPKPAAAESPADLTKTMQIPSMWKKEEKPSAASQQTGQPGEFTSLFQAPIQTKPVPAAPPAGKPAPAPAANQPEEFTSLFQAPIQTKPVPVAPPAAKPAPAPAADQPGEFTSLFQTPVQTKPSPTTQDVPPVTATAVPAEFTKLFQAPIETKPMPVAPSVAKPSPPPVAEQPGEFTKLFKAPIETKPMPVAPPAASVPRPQPMPPPANKPGEFTRMFQAPAPPESGPAASAARADSPLNAAAPGEFTRMFQSPVTGPSGAPPPAGPAPVGDFNRLLDPLAPGFAGGSRPGPMPSQPPRANPAPQAPPPPPSSGDFTRMFAQPAAHAGPANPFAPPPASGSQPAPPQNQPPQFAPAAPQVPASYGGDATRLFSTPSAQTPQAQTPAGPSEFTRMFSAPAAPPAPAMPSAPTPPAAPAESKGASLLKSPSLLHLILFLVLILVIGAALVFFLRR